MGGVLPPNANIKQLYEKLKKTINLAMKNEPTVKCRIGQEDTPDDNIIDNILTAYNSVIQKLPNEEQNVKNVMLKLTMGPAFVVGKDAEDKGDRKKGKAQVKIKPEKKKEKPAEQKPEIKEKQKAAKPTNAEGTKSQESKKEAQKE